mgnify:CR=1 FL=1
MRFGRVPLGEAAGAILAHSVKAPGLSFKKGRVLSADDVAALTAAGIAEVVAARLEAGDLHEDPAAETLARALAGEGVTVSAAFTGRCNLIAERRGLLLVDGPAIDAINLVDEAVTVATLPPFVLVEPRQMLATVKIIPFSAPAAAIEVTAATAAKARVRVAPLRPKRIGLVQTRAAGTREVVLDKTLEVLNRRLLALDCPAATDRRCGHDEAEIAEAVAAFLGEGVDILLVSGASAIVDRCDVVPAGIVAAGGHIDHFGMPVDPGNLILLAHAGNVPVLGLPGCARSPKLNGFDWVLQRLLAEVPVTPRDVMAMGVGGLLKEIGTRPLPRAEAVEAEDQADGEGRAPKIGALVLAAGQSRRMGGPNKLLLAFDGAPLVRRAVEAVLGSQAAACVVVTGHQREGVEGALSGLGAELVHNPDFADGLSTSLKRGIAALPPDLDGVLVVLGDMPAVDARVLDRLIAAFDPLEGRALCVPTWNGKRGNPVLIARRFFAELQALSGDVGARGLLSEHAEAVAEVPMADDGVLRDLDTPADWQAAGVPL